MVVMLLTTVVPFFCDSPSSFSAMARAIHSNRHVRNFFTGDQTKFISFDAYLEHISYHSGNRNKSKIKVGVVVVIVVVASMSFVR